MPLKNLLACALIICSVQMAGNIKLWADSSSWQRLRPGLHLASFNSAVNSDFSSSQELVILKIDPDRFDFKLLSASEHEDRTLNIAQWVEEFDLVAAINAGMFWKDQKTSTGYMKNFGHINNKRIHPDYGAFFVFHPKSPDLPKVRILDRIHTPGWREQINKYHTVIQNYRMISLRQGNVWEKQNEKYSVASIGINQEGKVLFIFNQPPRAIHKLNRILLSLPIDIKTCMFAEGGPTSALYVKTEELERGWHGVSESTLWSEKAGRFFKVPNIIGVVERR